MEPATLQRVNQRIDFAVKAGFDLASFVRGEDAALEAGESYLEARRANSTPAAYNNDVKWINNLSRFLRYSRDIAFPFVDEPEPQLRALNEQELARVLTSYHHPDPYVHRLRRAVVNLEGELGLRVSELASLEVQDLDAARSLVHIRFPAKGGKRRWLPVSRWQWQPDRPLGQYLTVRKDDPADKNALWVTTGHGQTVPHRMSAPALRNLLYRVSRSLNVPLTSNIFRHTKGYQLRKRGFDIAYIQKFLGHASITSTAVYAEVSPEDVINEFHRRPTPDYFAGGDERGPKDQETGT